MSKELDTDWETLFLWNETPYFGYCSSVDEAETSSKSIPTGHRRRSS